MYNDGLYCEDTAAVLTLTFDLRLFHKKHEKLSQQEGGFTII